MAASSVWNDNCEYDSMVDKDCHCYFEGKGSTIGTDEAGYEQPDVPAVSNEAVHGVQSDRFARSSVVCRSGHAGIQRYAQVWAGDNLTCWDTLKYNIATILGMGLSGVANHGCDVGGFYGVSPEPELFVRWVQNGIFMPSIFHPLDQHRQYGNGTVDVHGQEASISGTQSSSATA